MLVEEAIVMGGEPVELAIPLTLRGNLLEMVSVGVILLADRNRIAWTNSRAEAVLDRATHLRVVDGRLQGIGVRGDGRLRTMLDSIAGERDGNHLARLVRFDDEPGGTSMLAYGLSPGALPLELSGPLVLAIIWDEQQTPRPSLPMVEQLYGLTPAEARVATSITAGRSVGDIADELQVQANTVRAHLKAIYSKTGAIGQADLVRRMLCGPAGLGCFSRTAGSVGGDGEC